MTKFKIVLIGGFVIISLLISFYSNYYFFEKHEEWNSSIKLSNLSKFIDYQLKKIPLSSLQNRKGDTLFTRAYLVSENNLTIVRP